MAGEALQHERQVFDSHLNEWRQSHPGEFVLIKGGNVVGFYSSLEEAFREGTRRFGLEPFFVRQILPSDVVNVSLFGKSLLSA
jgi:hypothetical protein